MKQPLCAWVIAAENRFCRKPSAYRDGGKEYCGIHAPRVGATEPILRPRRELYRNNGRATGRWTDGQQEQEMRSSDMSFMAKATVAREEGDEWVLPDEDEYEAKVARIEPFETDNYNDKKNGVYPPRRETHARIVYEITEEGEFKGATADSIYNPSLNEKAKLYPVFKAITGITPDPGKSYDLEMEMVGKPCRILIEHRVSDRGGRFAGVSTVLPVRRKKAAAATPAPLKKRLQADDDDEDDDLDDA